MSCTFSIPRFVECADDCEGSFSERSDQLPCDACASREVSINLANANARDLLGWLGLSREASDPGLCGDLPVVDTLARCQRRLWDEERNHDAARAGEELTRPGGAVIVQARRPADYLRAQTGRLLQLLERARALGVEKICYG